jgi:hypothetical protein
LLLAKLAAVFEVSGSPKDLVDIDKLY